MNISGKYFFIFQGYYLTSGYRPVSVLHFRLLSILSKIFSKNFVPYKPISQTLIKSHSYISTGKITNSVKSLASAKSLKHSILVQLLTLIPSIRIIASPGNKPLRWAAEPSSTCSIRTHKTLEEKFFSKKFLFHLPPIIFVILYSYSNT